MTNPDWWPTGVSEEIVRDCNCDYCSELADALDDWRADKSVDGEHKAITSFS